MPLTTGFTSRAAAKGEGHIHSDKWHRCVEHVKAKGGGYEPHAVCTNAIGYKESVNPEHRTPGPHASANTRRFKEAAKRRKEAKKLDYITALKFNPNHDKEDGKFTSGPGGTARVQGELFTKGKEGSKSTLTPAQQAMQDVLERQSKKPVHKVATAEEAVLLVLKGENVEIQDTREVHTLLKKLGEMAIEAKSKKEKAPNFDPCTITVKHVSLFCAEKIKTAEFPHGIPRIEMPQFKSKNPTPNSEADKLPRDDEGEVDGSQEFLKHLTALGVETNPNGLILARKLKASQAEMEGVKVAGMMLNPERDPKKAKIWVSKDGYVIDGHHTWAAAIGRDAEDGNLDNDKEMEVVIVDLPMSEVYHMSVAWTRKYGLPAAGVKKWERILNARIV